MFVPVRVNVPFPDLTKLPPTSPLGPDMTPEKVELVLVFDVNVSPDGMWIFPAPAIFPIVSSPPSKE